MNCCCGGGRICPTHGEPKSQTPTNACNNQAGQINVPSCVPTKPQTPSICSFGQPTESDESEMDKLQTPTELCMKHNLPIPCKGCQFEQSPIWDKKPQTPLTAAHFHHSRSDRWLKKDEDFASFLERGLQEAEEKAELYKSEWENGKDALKEAERQRDEAMQRNQSHVKVNLSLIQAAEIAAQQAADDERAADSTTDLDSRLNYLAQQERALAIEKAIRSAAMPNQKMIEWEIELASPEAFVTISAPEDAKDDQLLALACDELTRKTYIWSKKRTNPPNEKS